MADKSSSSPLARSSCREHACNRATITGVISAVAGAPCGLQTRRGREGSFLVLVVGTLALLAVITIVYVALGNADTRTKAATQSRVQQDNVAPKVADYIASVIADDVLATEYTGEVTAISPNTGQPAGPAVLRRETSDAPGVRPNLSSAPNAAANRRFDPAGTVDADLRQDLGTNNTAPGNRDNIVPASDPFLASMIPVNFKYQFATGQGGNAELPDPSRPYLYDLDWLVISNFAPDGAFVNLDNLRGNFAASSLTLRQNKTLFDVEGRVTDRLVFGDPGRPGEVADQDNPAHWTMYQQRAFQPGSLTSQWADADGDGMLDSRIFEMIDGQASDARRIAPELNTPGVRYFVAARAVDLSGMVNLTTATDFTTGTNNAFIAGATPADVDIKRLLTQVDILADQNPFGNVNTPAGYQLLVQSADPANLDGAATPDSPQNYADYTESAAWRAGSSAYAALRLSRSASSPIGREVLEGGAIFSLAETDYTLALQDTQLGIFAAGLKNLNPGNAAQFKRLQTIFGSPYPATGALPPVLTTTEWASQRTLAWNESLSRAVGGAYDTANAGLGTLPGGFFTTADLTELLTRFGMNSDERSAIEGVVGGRDATNGPLSTRFDPLRSNRPEALELIRFEVDPTAGIDLNPPVDGLQDRVMRLFASDVRRFITPLSGARQLRSSAISAGSPTDQLSGEELKINLRSALDALNGIERGDLPSLYRGYAAGLAPFSSLTATYARDQFGTAPLASRTLSYGYRGPEAALLASAHMAVNLKDFADADARPSSATVVFSRDAYDVLAAAAASNATVNTNDVTEPLRNYSPWFPGIDGWNYVESQAVSASRQLFTTPDPADLPPVNTDDLVAPAVNVYGVEPQIFITQVSTLTVYADLPEEPIPSDLDTVKIETSFPEDRDTSPQREVKAELNNTILSGKRSEVEDSEIAARVIAFKVVNPFDRPIQLSEAPFGDGDASRPASTTLSSPERWWGGRFIDIDTFRNIAGDSNGAVRLDSMRDYQYIRVGEGPGARYFLLMALQQQINGLGVSPGPDAPTGAAGEYAADVPSRDAPVITLNPIVLAPGETVLLYAVSEPPERIADRLDAERGLRGSNQAGVIESFLTNQLAQGTRTDDPATPEFEGMRRFWIPMYAPILPSGEPADPAVTYTGSGIDAASGLQNMDDFVDVIPADPATATPRSVTLWRADRRLARERTAVASNLPNYLNWAGDRLSETYGNPADLPAGSGWQPPANVFQPNDVRNDILLDRFKVPFGAQFDSALVLPAGLTRLELRDTDVRTDREGRTLMTARTMRRPADPGMDFRGGPKPQGILPVYCIEPKYTDANPNTDETWNVADASLILTDPDVTSTGVLPVGRLYETQTPSDAPAGQTDAIIGGAFDSVQDAADTLITAAPTDTLIINMARKPQDWYLGGANGGDMLDNATDGTFPGRVFAATHGNRPQQVGNNFPRALYTYYNEMYPSLLASGESLVADPAVATSDLVVNDMFRALRFNRQATAPAGTFPGNNQIPFTLPDGTSVPRPDPADPNFPLYNTNISTLRLTDLLLPLGIGPMEVPASNLGGGWPGTVALSANSFFEARARYTTLGEAVAIAMGYEVTGAGILPANYQNDPALWWAPREQTGEYRLPLPQVPAAPEESLRSSATDVLMFDKGALAIDRFVPFVDVDGDGRPNAGTTFEPVWGLGITPAANVLEQFTIIDAPSGLGAPPAGGNATAIRDYLARVESTRLTTAVPGLINLNTAPVQVLRTLPMASPAPTFKAGVAQSALVGGAAITPPNAQRRSFSTGDNAFDFSPFLDFRVTTPGVQTPPVLDQAADIAPTLASYRDLYPERFRRDTMVFMANRLEQLGMVPALRASLLEPNPDAPYNQLSFTGADALANRIVPMLWTWAAATPARDWIPRLWSVENKTRERATGIPGVRSQPGFRSPGELIIARALWPEAASNVALGLAPVPEQPAAFRQQIVRGLPTNPDFLAFDQYLQPTLPGSLPARGLPANFRGLDPTQRHTVDDVATAAVTTDLTSPNSPSLRQQRNPISEKLLIPGAMMSATTTRSDVYAVWFTIFGFREADVGPAGSTDPLQPSVQRRFLMVIDRSNVTQLGQKPRIVLLKEVPM